MEGLAHLVAESLDRHGVETAVDHRRLQWSPWFRCRDSFSFLLAPCKPGLFALAEEVTAPCAASEPRGRHPERSEGSPAEGKRMLALYRISEAADLGMAMGRLFLPGNPERERLSSGRCFARYVVVEDSNQRRAAFTAMQRWMASNADLHESYVVSDALVRAADQGSTNFAPRPDSELDGFVTGHDFSRAVKTVSRNAALAAAATWESHGASVGFVTRRDPEPDGFVSGHDFSRAVNPTTRNAALAAAAPADASEPHQSSNKEAQIGPPAPIPSGF